MKQLGRGGMGVVYLAHDPDLNRLVALKTPLVTARGGPEALERFRQAARAVASLRHPNICPVYDAGVMDGVPYLAMAFIEGATLQERLRVSGPFPAGQAASLVRKLALALREAHRQGVVHRDVKPSNILIDLHGEPILTDFGLARRLDRPTRLTPTRALVGTPAYMAPEQVRGGGVADPAGDVYSLGVVLYELLTGRLPFTGPNEAVLFAEILTREATPPSVYRPDLDAALEGVCLRAMAKEPANRHPDMTALADGLEPHADDLAPVVVSDAGPGPDSGDPPPEQSWSLPLSFGDSNQAPPPPPARRRPWRPVASAAAGLLLAVASVFAYTQLQYLWKPPTAPSSAPPAPAREETGHEEPAPGPAPADIREREAPPEIHPARTIYEHGRLAADRRDAEQAVRDFTEALRLEPECGEAFIGRARVLLERNDCARAVRDATEAIRIRPQCGQAYLVRGRAYYRQGLDDLADADAAEAFRLFEKDAALPPPVYARDLAERAAFYLQVDRRDKAVDDAEAAVRLDSTCPAGYLQLAQAYHDLGRREEEIAVYADALAALQPAAAVDHADRARLALEGDKIDDALRDCDEAIRTDRRSPAAYEVRAKVRRRKGDREGARADFLQAARLAEPRCARDFLDRSLLYEKAGQPEQALEDAEQALELAPRLAAAFQRRGEARKARPNRERPDGDFKQALAASVPKYAAAFLARAWLHDELREPDKAIADGEEAWKLGLRSGELHQELGYAYSRKKDYRNALNHFNEAARLLPTEAMAFAYRGDVRFAQGEFAEAVRDYTQAAALDPQFGRVYRDRARALLKQGADKFDDAMRDFGRALEVAPDDLRTYVERGDALVSRGRPADYQSAMDDFTRVLDRTPAGDHAALADLYNRRGVCRSRLEQWKAAAADYARAVENDPNDPVLYRNRAAVELRLGDESAAADDETKARALEARKP